MIRAGHFLADNRPDHNREIAPLDFVSVADATGTGLLFPRTEPEQLVQAIRNLRAAIRPRPHIPTAALLLLLLAGCPGMNYQDRARTPLKPMKTVVKKESEAFDAPPKVLEGMRPDYPEPEGENRQKGFVSLICTIDAHGRLTQVEIEKATSASFAYEAIRAVAKWKFAPALKDGHPVAGKLRVPLHFNAL